MYHSRVVVTLQPSETKVVTLKWWVPISLPVR